MIAWIRTDTSIIAEYNASGKHESADETRWIAKQDGGIATQMENGKSVDSVGDDISTSLNYLPLWGRGTIYGGWGLDN